MGEGGSSLIWNLGDNGETGKKQGGGKKITVKIVATNVVASRQPNVDRLQHRPLVPKDSNSIFGK